MIRVIVILIGLVWIGCTAGKSGKDISLNPVTVADSVVERIAVENDFFTELILTADPSIENGSYNKLMIFNGNDKVFEIYNQSAFDSIDLRALAINNELMSNYVLLQNIDRKFFISLFGAEYGCCPRHLTILQVDNEGIVKIFDEPLYVENISMLNTDEIQYLGIDAFSESFGVIDSLGIELSTYNPTLVYILGEGFKFDSVSTRHYNEENYVFAGYAYDSKIKVAQRIDRVENERGKMKPYVYTE